MEKKIELKVCWNCAKAIRRINQSEYGKLTEYIECLDFKHGKICNYSKYVSIECSNCTHNNLNMGCEYSIVKGDSRCVFQPRENPEIETEYDYFHKKIICPTNLNEIMYCNGVKTSSMKSDRIFNGPFVFNPCSDCIIKWENVRLKEVY